MASDIQDDGQQEYATAAAKTNGSAATSAKGRPASLELALHDDAPLNLISPHPEQRTPLFAESDNEDDDDDGRDDSGSDPITSPSSVTSPPYWSAHAAAAAAVARGYHRRGPSNISMESVAAPGAITLQDNEYDDGPDGSNVYGRDRNRACWARSVQVRDYVLVNGSTTNIGAFVVWNIKVETLNGSYMNVRKRYSEFDDLRRRLVQTFPGFEAAVPVLPPKNFIAKFRPRFLEKRRAGLQYFLNCILLNPEFSGSPVLKDFLFS